LLEALADHPVSEHGEPVQRAPLIAGGLTADMAAIARKAESRRRRDVPAMAATRADLLRELRAIKATNTASKLAAMLWGYVEDLLADDGPDASGRLELVEIEGGERAFRLYGLSAIGKGWRDVPTLHLGRHGRHVPDFAPAFPAPSISRPSRLASRTSWCTRLSAEFLARRPLQHGSAGPDARRFVLATAVRERRALAGDRGARPLPTTGGKRRPPTWPLPIGATFGGLDSFNDVRGLVCVGRWGVAPNAVGRMAAILTGRAIPRVEGWYPTQATTLTAADGSAARWMLTGTPTRWPRRCARPSSRPSWCRRSAGAAACAGQPRTPLRSTCWATAPLPVPPGLDFRLAARRLRPGHAR
jgi:hypothetical protein